MMLKSKLNMLGSEKIESTKVNQCEKSREWENGNYSDMKKI